MKNEESFDFEEENTQKLYSVTKCDNCKHIFDTDKIKKCPLCNKNLTIIKDNLSNIEKLNYTIKYPIEVCDKCITIIMGYSEVCKHCGNKLKTSWENKDRILTLKMAQEDNQIDEYI